MPSRPATRSGRARATSSAIHPPMLEPTRICGPSVTPSSTASASASQVPIVPSSKAPEEAP